MRDLLPGYSVTSVQSRDESNVDRTYLVKKKLTAEQRSLTEGDNMKAGSDLAADMLNELSVKLVGRLPLKADGSIDMTAAFPEKNTVGARVSGEIQNKAVQAILLSLIAIIIYMNFRFKEYRYGFAAVVALFHDVLFTLGALALFSKMGWVTVEINLEIIAAFLTIIGYSLNDTIVVFDRIRENLPRSKGSYHEIIDKSINQSLSRTILTSVTTFFVVAVLFFANRPMHNVLEGFSFAMLVGVIVGTYSSMFVASPLLVFFDRWSRKHHVKEAK
jgi:preprotein translocase SecF subunit